MKVENKNPDSFILECVNCRKMSNLHLKAFRIDKNVNGFLAICDICEPISGLLDVVMRKEEIPPDNRIRCSQCGTSVSTPVPPDTIVRAWIECPECIEKKPDSPEGITESDSLG